MRCGAWTAAPEVQQKPKRLADTMTHGNKNTTIRYIRRRERNIKAMAEARKTARSTTE